ncbi:hypothetical protein N431DRAFT_409051 [Stipitochalara longipes BDJ]|nr:hypothetical protein N431DRAFT_409051 [Stipitochalara longipes BDJ]
MGHAKPERARLSFQFIGETGLSRPKGANLRLVRSQARRRAPSRQQIWLSKRESPPLRPHKGLDRSRSEETLNSVVMGSLSHLVLRNSEAGLKSNPLSNFVDPFNTLRIGEGGKTQYLISQYHSIFYPTESAYSPIRPIFGKEESLHNSLSDPALLHISLAHVAKTLSSLASIDMNLNIAYHVGKAIAIVNKRIANSQDKAITNETIGAVTSLTAFEFRTGSIASLKIHLDGVEALVKSIGGLQTLSHTPFILKYTCWVDVVGAIILGSKPRFENTNPAFPLLDPYLEGEDIQPCSVLGARYKARLSNLTGLPDLSQKMIEAYRILRHLINKKERLAGLQRMEIPEAEFQHLQSFCTQLMYRLIALIQYETSPNLPNENALVFRIFGNAAVAHILMFTYNMPLRSDTHVLMSTRIRACLEMINVQAFQMAYPEMMLWVIMIGGLGSIETGNQGWFIQLLAKSWHVAGIFGTAELALSLNEFLWSDFYLGPMFNEFWNGVAVARAVLEARNRIS